jgi:V/A-type H+-transporting ATPase subunit D
MAIAKIHPTRINLIRTKKTLKLSKSGLDVLERKRDVLIRELRRFIYDARKLREEVTSVLAEAFQSLIESKVRIGAESVENVTLASTFKANFVLDHRSIMGVPVPIVDFQMETDVKPDYGFADTNISLDKTFRNFSNVLKPIAQLAEIEGVAFKLANDVQKTQKRVNALKHVFIPMYSETVKYIERVLEEKEREEFVRMKTAKKMISKKKTIG